MERPSGYARTPVLAAVVIALAFAAVEAPAGPRPDPASTQARAVDYVIHVSVDGLLGERMQTLVRNNPGGRYGNFKRLVDEGASTFNARTDFTHTNTIPNHTTMLTGRPVLQPVGQPWTVHHGYTNNGDPRTTDTLHNRGNPRVPYVASVFDVVHDHGLTTGLYASKSKFIIYEQSYNAAQGAPDVTGEDNGTDKIDRYVNLSTGVPLNASNMHAAFIQDLSTNPAHYSFVHYRDPDSVGHATGWGNSTWDNSVATVDGYIGEILDVIENSTVLQGRTVLIVTSDHGGIGTGHSNPSRLDNYRIPFFVWGASIASDVELYAFSDGSRTDPGTGRPSYNAAAPVRNGDSGNLALDLLELPPIPGSTINADFDLRVGEQVIVEKRSIGSVKGLYR